MSNALRTSDWVNIAYKKLKSSVYFDKTLLPLVDKIVSFENKGFQARLNEIVAMLDMHDDSVWQEYIDNIISQMDVLIYPKKLRAWQDEQVIFNADNEPIEIEKAQYFIDMQVIGHILGVLWVLTIGAQLDNHDDPDNLPMYEHSYGNRLRKNLFNSDSQEITYSPYLFEPYFSQYESWRDTALAHAKERLGDKQDALILTLDLRSFFYGVHIPKDRFDEILPSELAEKLPGWVMRIHNFVYCVLEEYSQKVNRINIDPELLLGQRVFLPIGFWPSYILSNWILNPFDEAIHRRFNPVYYGRYVDDIIIVDKVEKNSPLRRLAQGKNSNNSKLTAQHVMEYYFCSCFSSNNMAEACKQQQLFLSLEWDEMTPLQKEAFERAAQKGDKQNSSCVYRINPNILPREENEQVKPEIQVQNDKVKVFYFREGASRALLDCFRTQIGKNASEFRFLPDMDDILGKNDYSEIFKLQNDETLHKLRGVTGVSVDKFALSKFLGKYRKAGGMIRDKKETGFDRNLLTILNKRTLIENYTLWERLLEIMVVNDRLEHYEKLVKNILAAIAIYNESKTLVCSSESSPYALLKTLRAAVCRTMALYWGCKADVVLNNIQESVQSIFPSEVFMFSFDLLTEQRIRYCHSRMVNKYIVPLPLEWINEKVYLQKESNINLCHLESFFHYADWTTPWDEYPYLPYMLTPQEISYALICKDIAVGAIITPPDGQLEHIKERYLYSNFGIDKQINKATSFDEIKVTQIKDKDKPCQAITICSPTAKKLKVAIGNAKLYKEDFKLALTGKPNCSHKRYQQVCKLLREAIEANANLLVLPESFLPLDWVPNISRLCANNQVALITGVEHILSAKTEGEEQRVYNLTAVILPYRKDDFKFAHVVYHQKVHFSPEEKRQIEGYRLHPAEGREYQLFQWRDVWFSVYCCFELASIAERALFQSLADLIVAVEWNQDVPYFSNIIESLCRDLHCYCMQVNSSDFGDSRVISPRKTELRDIIKTKGGTNHTILTEEIDIEALRDFQRMEYELQKEDGRFKPTPPNFEPSIPERKQNGTLWKLFDT